MSTTFTKLFSSITESTVWCEPAHTRLVWITMLAMADRRGRVWASVPGLANRARVPLEDTEKALATFLAPDKYSRTPDHEGRRIEPIDGGWQLLNHAKYREMRDDEVRREYQREWDRKNRPTRNPTDYDKSDKSRPQTTNADTEAEADTEKKKTPLAPDASRRALKKVGFDFAKGTFTGITEDQELAWQDAYPAVPVPPAIARAAAWLVANPNNRKSNYQRFLVNWLAREQDKAARVPSGRPQEKRVAI